MPTRLLDDALRFPVGVIAVRGRSISVGHLRRTSPQRCYAAACHLNLTLPANALSTAERGGFTPATGSTSRRPAGGSLVYDD